MLRSWLASQSKAVVVSDGMTVSELAHSLDTSPREVNVKSLSSSDTAGSVVRILKRAGDKISGAGDKISGANSGTHIAFMIPHCVAVLQY